MWSQLSQCSQLLLSTTMVATPIMIVAQNHNCRNLVNHKVAIFQKNFDLVNVYTWLKDDASLSVLNLDSIFHNIIFIFWPANLLQYILEAYNFVLRANPAISLCKAYRFITIFAMSVARRNIPKMKFAYILTKIHVERFCNWACRSLQVFRFMPKNIIIA